MSNLHTSSNTVQGSPDRFILFLRWALVLVALSLAGIQASLAFQYWSTQKRVLIDPANQPQNAELVAAFERFLAQNQIEHFSAKELLTPGGSHRSFRSSAYGLNRLPPKALWDQMLPTLLVMERLREEMGQPLIIFSGYRSPAYNRAVGGASRSQHRRFTAFDIAPQDGKTQSVEKLYKLALKLRDEDKIFAGGIGSYKTWVHIDTRGHKADW